MGRARKEQGNYNEVATDCRGNGKEKGRRKGNGKEKQEADVKGSNVHDLFPVARQGQVGHDLFRTD